MSKPSLDWDARIRATRRHSRIIDRHFDRVQAALLLICAGAIWLLYIEPIAQGATACAIEQPAQCPEIAR